MIDPESTTLLKPVGSKTVPGLGLLLVMTAATLAWVGFEWWRTGPGSVWDPYSLTVIAWYLLSALAVAWAMVAASRPAPAYTPVAVRTILIGLLAVLSLSMLGRWGEYIWTWISGGFIAVACFHFSWYLLRVTGRRQYSAPLLGAVGAFAFWWVTVSYSLSADIWFVADDSLGDRPQLTEKLLFDQADRIDAAVAAMQTEAGDKPQAFFVGFAGYGEQHVFAEEIALASKVVTGRYHTGARSIRLINDRRDPGSYPLGTVSGLSRALQGIAKRMNTAKDVLILSLSSHGSEAGELSVSNGILPLETLTDHRLGEILRQSGIHWKVIIISACHAGTFIDDLQDDSTIIVTAAAADRTSFGCSDDRDLTYFGEAFYRDALPKAGSLREAFDLAKSAIAIREQEEGVEPSQPHAVFSEALEQRLKMLQ